MATTVGCASGWKQHERPHVLAVKAPLWALVAGQGAIQVPAKDLATAEPLEGWRRLRVCEFLRYWA
jgi:hypothetical protein